jgi:hypothetical protein
MVAGSPSRSRTSSLVRNRNDISLGRLIINLCEFAILEIDFVVRWLRACPFDRHLVASDHGGQRLAVLASELEVQLQRRAFDRLPGLERHLENVFDRLGSPRRWLGLCLTANLCHGAVNAHTPTN